MDNKNFKNKKILFFSVKLFNYENIIADKLRSLGAVVDYYDERPSNSIFSKGIIRLKRDLYNVKISNYYNSILQRIKNEKYDYFFLIKGEVVPQYFIDKLKVLNPEIVLLYYTFDSFENNPNGINIIQNFNRKYTFDSKDAESYNLSFRPLFFSDDYYKLKNEEDQKYDLLFIGTAHSDRYVISEQTAKWCDENKLKSFAFYYSPSRLVFLFFKLFDSSFKKFKYNKISFTSLKHQEIIELYKQSKVVLDINHPNQRGLTMRVFEALGSGKKLITTNFDIKRYPFYNENNIYIIDRGNIVLEYNFFNLPFEDIDQKLYDRMSISGWLNELFFDDKSFDWLKINKDYV
ncbi:glycosyltransferase family protein [Flavobacterium hungaricum]|uniref:Lipopolysaccharide biosynthesis protein n=1 Tax=Flavobacterium hungaricum TaxID=2082725 RepID=A0ABR9TSJ5_9FLAO|nr:lipopolysaccharide biosynthesis protein [Flavobacterium hungaricum]MBE8727764.1 lipopolysaccharide biosynthesis protein [Flavobacterium hungaricum]